ncbi:ABC transporter substrate-binding protein [Thermoproteota archaeon]
MKIQSISTSINTLSGGVDSLSGKIEGLADSLSEAIEGLVVEEPVVEEEDVELIIGTTRNVGGVMTPTWVTGEMAVVVDQLFEGLVQYRPGTNELEPILAESYETEDAQSWTFHLRKGIKFHDGTSFDATAVKDHFDRSFETEAGLTYLYTRFLLEDSRENPSVVVIDDYTVEFNLQVPHNGWPKILANFAAFIESPTSVETYGLEGMNEHPTGTGPFKFVSQKLEDNVIVEANQDWWRLDPSIAGDAYAGIDEIQIDRVKYQKLADASTLRFATEIGQIDIAKGDFNPDDFADLLANPDLLAIDRGAAEGMRYAIFQGNPSFETFQSKTMRQAFAYAIDVDLIIESVFKGYASRAQSYMPVEYEEYKDVYPYEYNPEKAKELIAAAGFETPVKIEVHWSTEYGSTERDVISIIKTSAAEAGFDVDTSNSWERASFREMKGAHAMEVSLWRWSADYFDHDAWTTPFMSSTGSKNRDYELYNTDFGRDIGADYVDALVIEAIGTADPDRKMEVLHEIQDLHGEYLPEFFLWRPKKFSFVSKEFQDVLWGPIGHYDFDYWMASKTK